MLRNRRVSYRAFAKTVSDAVRLAEVGQILVKHGFYDLMRRLGLLALLPSRLVFGSRQDDAPGHTVGARLRAALTELGPTYIKLGQIMSTRPDVLGTRLSDELRQLQDDVAPVPFEAMKPVLEGTLGRPLKEVFAAFEEEPVASASMSQVYRARLHTGEDVAVKVLRPGIKDTITSDVSLLHSIAHWTAENVEDLDWFDGVGTVEQFERSIMRELDMAVEARTIQQFAENFRDSPKVFVPEVYAQASSSQVLTMDWIDGVRVDDLEAYEDRESSPETVARHGCEILCEQIFVHRLFHADPHPGNVMLLRNDQLAFIDYGMVGHLEERDVEILTNLLLAIANRDTKNAVETVLLFTDTDDVEDRTALENELADFLAFEAQTVVAEGRVGQALEKVSDLLGRHKLRLAPRFVLFIKALATIEATARTLAPNLDILELVRPYAERLVHERFQPEHLLKEGQGHLFTLLRLAREMPTELNELIRTIRRGKLKFLIDPTVLDNLVRVLDRASNRLAFSVVTGALIIGSSLLMGTEIGATLGLIGFIIAGVVGLVLLVSILRSGHY